MTDEPLDYEATLRTLLGLLGNKVRIELSGAVPGFRAGAGFSGVLERGVEDVVQRVVGSDEAINFRVIEGGHEGWFIVGQSTFQTAVIVRSGAWPALVIRAGQMDVTVTPEPGAL